MKQQSSKRTPWRAVWLIVILLSGLAGGGWWLAREAGLFAAPDAVQAADLYQTTAARRADLARSVTGSGTLVAGQTAELGFAAPGVVADLAVQAGDSVQKGQVLARLEDTAGLELAVQNQALAVRTAEKNLADVQSDPQLALAAAEVERAAAQTALDEAAASLRRPGDSRCASSLTLAYYSEWLTAKQRADVWEGHLDDPHTGYGLDYILENLKPLRKARDQAYMNMKYCESYTAQEIQESQAVYQAAEARLEQAERQQQRLSESGGVDLQALEMAQAALKSARLQQARAENELAGAVITAPMDSTVMTVGGSAGDAVGTGAFITLADLSQPKLRVSIDETDLPDFAAGCQASVTFDSLPGQTFSGLVSEVAPLLVTTRDVVAAQGWVTLNEKQAANGSPLPPGLAASVSVTCQQAEDALLVPALALLQPHGQPPYVYVLNAQGQPEKREVVVGIQTAASVEIRGGLEEGERVITSAVAEE